MSTSIGPELLRQILEKERDEDSNSQELFYSDLDALENSLASSRRPLSGRKTPRNKRRPQRVPSLELPLPTNLDVASPLKLGQLRSPERDNDQYSSEKKISPSAYQQQRPKSHRQQHSPQHLHHPHHPHPYHQQQVTSRPKSSRHTPRLPPLEISVLQRPRLFLSPSGEARVGIEEIYQIEEVDLNPRTNHSSPFQLIAMPKKCMLDDEAAVMPMYRGQPLEVDLWKEPIRDRDKNWFQDELTAILALQDRRNVYKMTDTRRRHKGKWSHFEAFKVSKDTSASATPVDLSSQEIFIRNQAIMVSKTYVIVSVYGVGIRGRLYGPGLHHTNRYLRLEAYEPLTCQRHTLKLTMENLEDIFEEKKEFLVAGKKQAICRELINLLYFQYPKEGEETEDVPQVPVTAGVSNDDALLMTSSSPETSGVVMSPNEILVTPSPPSSSLRISRERKPNEALKRRLQREECRRCEEEERLRQLALFMKLPKRARHRLWCCSLRVQGHVFLVSIYHLPTQVRNFLFIAYHPRTSQTFQLMIGVMQAAGLSQIYTLPHKWSHELKILIAKSLLPRVRLIHSNQKMALAIAERVGMLTSSVHLNPLQTKETRQLDLAVKSQRDQRMESQHLYNTQLQLLNEEEKEKASVLREQIQQLESQKETLKKRDEELKELIEEINAGKSTTPGTAAVNSQESTTEEQQQQANLARHELRKAYKTERVTLKDQLKDVTTSLAHLKQQKLLLEEEFQLKRDKCTVKFDKTCSLLDRELKQCMKMLGEEEEEESTSYCAMSRRTCHSKISHKLPKCLIQRDKKWLTSGACHVHDHRFRFTLYEQLDFFEKNSETAETPEKQMSTISETDGTEDNATSTCTTGDSGEDAGSTVVVVLPREEEKDTLFKLELYDPYKCQVYDFELTRLEWIVLTKQLFSVQFQIPAFKMDSPSGTTTNTNAYEQLVASDQEFDQLYQSFKDPMASSVLTTKKKVKRKASTIQKKQTKLYEEMKLNRQKRRTLLNQIPWHVFIQALCERFVLTEQKISLPMEKQNGELTEHQENLLTEQTTTDIQETPDQNLLETAPSIDQSEDMKPPLDQSDARVSSEAIPEIQPPQEPTIWLDRCIFSSITAILCTTMTLETQEQPDQDQENEEQVTTVTSEDEEPLMCVLKVFLQSDLGVLIEAYDPISCETWSLIHSDSQELVKEFAKANFMEMQLHLEVMCSTLMLYTHPITKERFLRFEE